MRVVERNSLVLGSSEFSNRIRDDVFDSLKEISTDGTSFIGNDTEWFAIKSAGQLKPTVLNSAHFLSGSFQSNLERRGWEREWTRDNQKIDGSLCVSIVLEIYDCDLSNFPKVTQELFRYADTDKEKETLISDVLHQFIKRGFRIDNKSIPESFYAQFSTTTKEIDLCVGLEFETGNIASSFRSLQKLRIMYEAGHIDYGIFVTFNDKENGSTRLFPASNRNSSFEELDNRLMFDSISFPLWQVGFEPDGYRDDADYFDKNGFFQPTKIGDETINGFRYEKFIHNGREIYRPRSTR